VMSHHPYHPLPRISTFLPLHLRQKSKSPMTSNVLNGIDHRSTAPSVLPPTRRYDHTICLCAGFLV
jgi:hypothetical protein